MEQALEDLRALIGQEIGVSGWMEITQERINAFAEATNDHQFIHVNPELAAQTPFGGTIAHGYLTLALVVPLTSEVEMPVGNPMMGINYGSDKIRFPAPVPVNSRIRARVAIDDVTEVPGGIQVKRTVTMEIEGQEKPGMVAETLVRLYY
ncbi:MAG: MaoC family dehydratase [Acidimicrobiia bacterium]